MNLPRAGVRSDFRRFKELNSELDKLEEEFSALNLSLPLQLGDLQNLETIATNLVDAINEHETQINTLDDEIDAHKADVGDKTNLTTTDKTNLVNAINELLMQIKEKTSYGVVSGLEVTAQDEPDMSVNVSEGIIYMQNGDRFEVDTDVISVDTADTTNARKDIIYVNSTGEITYLAGTAAEVPEAPSTPTGGLILAEIAVAANTTAIETSNITDKKKSILN